MIAIQSAATVQNGQDPVPYLRLATVADGGYRGAVQTAIAARVQAHNPDHVLFVGDNTYSTDAGLDDDWAAWDWVFATPGKGIITLGNHDAPGGALWQPTLDKFPDVFDGRRYYDVRLGNGLLSIFVANTGRLSNWTQGEPDGITNASAQADYMRSRYDSDTSIWKHFAGHHPPVTSGAGINRVEPAIYWDRYFSVHHAAHVHGNEFIGKYGTLIANVSTASKPVEPTGHALMGSSAGASLLWNENLSNCYCIWHITPQSMRVEVWTSDGQMIKSLVWPGGTDKRWNDAGELLGELAANLASLSSQEDTRHAGHELRLAALESGGVGGGAPLDEWNRVIYAEGATLPASGSKFAGFISRSFTVRAIRWSSLAPDGSRPLKCRLWQVPSSGEASYLGELDLAPASTGSRSEYLALPAAALIPAGRKLVVEVQVLAGYGPGIWQHLEVALLGEWGS